MTTEIEHGCAAVPHRYRQNTFLARFNAPRIGVRFVRGEDGSPMLYDTRESAERAARDAYFLAVNGKRRDPVSGKVQVVNRKARATGGRLAALVFGSS